MAEAIVTVAEVKGLKTSSGNTRFVLRDEEGREYTTFREEIARAALAAEGKRARVTFHEQQRGRFTNVYLDSVDGGRRRRCRRATRRRGGGRGGVEDGGRCGAVAPRR